MSYCTTYVLQQHTPLIHFQHAEAGATLRATEVKPKLDKYLAERLKAANVQIPASWLLRQPDKKSAEGPDEYHFNYKLRFLCEKSSRVDLRTPAYNLYWCNMRTDPNPVRGVMAEQGVEMKIICLIPDLMAQIRQYVSDFFICHNFGRMQGKGFGSFTVKDGNRAPEKTKIVNALCRHYQAGQCYWFDGGKMRLPMARIKTIWSVMKSGYNFQKKYRRSLLFMYMHTPKFQIKNEKAWMKQKGYAGDPPYCQPMNEGKVGMWHNEQNSETAYFVRALLGVGDHVDFLTNEKGIKYKVTINHKSMGAKFRYHAPVFFKVIDNKVYYVGEKVNDRMLDVEFKFSGGAIGSSKTLSTPPRRLIGERFIEDFLAYCYEMFECPPQGQNKLSEIEPGLFVSAVKADNREGGGNA